MAADQTPSANTNVTAGVTPPPSGAANNSSELPSAFSLFKPSWEGLKLNLTELIVIFVVPTLIVILLFIVGASAANSSSGIMAVLIGLGVVIGLVYAALIGPAIIHIQLKSSLMEKASYDSAWATSKKFWWRFILLSIVIGVVVLIGFILLIVPGVIFLKRYYLSHYALIDQDLGLGASMSKSNELSKNRSMTVYGLLGVDLVINIPSAIPIIGQLITFVLQIAYFCAPAIRYQQLKKLKPISTKPSVA